MQGPINWKTILISSVWSQCLPSIRNILAPTLASTLLIFLSGISGQQLLRRAQLPARGLRLNAFMQVYQIMQNWLCNGSIGENDCSIISNVASSNQEQCNCVFQARKLQQQSSERELSLTYAAACEPSIPFVDNPCCNTCRKRGLT